MNRTGEVGFAQSTTPGSVETKSLTARFTGAVAKFPSGIVIVTAGDACGGLEHEPVAHRFATAACDKFANDDLIATSDGSTVLVDAIATLECAVEEKQHMDGHVTLISRVEQAHMPKATPSAVYFERGFHALRPN